MFTETVVGVMLLNILSTAASLPLIAVQVRCGEVAANADNQRGAQDRVVIAAAKASGSSRLQ